MPEQSARLFAANVRRVLYLASLDTTDRTLVATADAIGQARPTSTPDAVMEQLARLPLPPIGRPTYDRAAGADESRLAALLPELARRHDPWLQALLPDGAALPATAALQQENGMLSTIEKVLYLKDCALFRDIPGEDLAHVAGLARDYRFSRGEVLIHEGQPGEALYIILKGEVDVMVGNNRRVARIGQHAVLGEMSLLSDLPCSATCVGVGSGRSLRIDRADFLPFLLEYPEVATALIQILTERLRDANQRVQDQSTDLPPAQALLPGTWSA